ncbi:MAG: efflux RND transporter periplasmic adaptor subunit [Pseudobacteriovorax sp.]|nr:efflux RND transporter periplasmic adaptor subunit [Pseudobacteriovorax sp.]
MSQVKWKALCLTGIFSALGLVQSALAQRGGPTPVFVAPVEKRDIYDEVEALGTLQANENVNLVANVTERITAIYFDDNQQVKKGDVLVEMDAAEEKAELAAESSKQKEANRQVKRLRPLVAKGAASKSSLDGWERELATANARILAIKSRIDERRIVAPFDGVVGLRNISVGDMAVPGSGQGGSIITTIDDISKMKLDFSVPEIFLSSLQKGIVIEAQSSAYPQKTFEGSVTSIDSRIDPRTRSVRARAMLDNPEALLKAGMLMRIKLKKNPRTALVIPEMAIVATGRQNSVMVVADGDETKVAKKEVKLGSRMLGFVEILSGLNEKDRVVTDGVLRVRDGSKVIIKATDTSSASLNELLQQSAQKGP